MAPVTKATASMAMLVTLTWWTCESRRVQGNTQIGPMQGKHESNVDSFQTNGTAASEQEIVNLEAHLAEKRSRLAQLAEAAAESQAEHAASGMVALTSDASEQAPQTSWKCTTGKDGTWALEHMGFGSQSACAHQWEQHKPLGLAVGTGFFTYMQNSWCRLYYCDGSVARENCALRGMSADVHYCVPGRTITRMQMCLTSTYENICTPPHCSKGTRKVTSHKGSRSSSSTEQQTSFTIGAEVQASYGYGPAQVAASVSSEFSTAMQSAVSASSQTWEETSLDIDLSKPVYVYQGQVSVWYDDGTFAVMQGSMITAFHEQWKGCKDVNF